MRVSDSKIELAWGDGDQIFKLRLGEIRELQEKCKAGPAEIAERLATSRWLLDDLREPIRLGLIGGGKKPPEALALVKRYVDERPLTESVLVAHAVIMAVLYGVPDDPVGKKDGAEEAKTGAMPTETLASHSPPSTEPVPPSASAPTSSTASPSGSSPPASTDGTAPMAARNRPSRRRTTNSTISSASATSA